jgi:hypothetical protein
MSAAAKMSEERLLAVAYLALCELRSAGIRESNHVTQTRLDFHRRLEGVPRTSPRQPAKKNGRGKARHLQVVGTGR